MVVLASPLPASFTAATEVVYWELASSKVTVALSELLGTTSELDEESEVAVVVIL